MSGAVRPTSARHTTKAGPKKKGAKGSLSRQVRKTADYIESMKLRSLSERLGCLSLRTAFDSI
jgi:hypothetical protein